MNVEEKEQQVMVSICCLAYNHEKYIRSALDSFVSQETDFPFEVLIHDDASTDATAAVIREYEEKYPQIIRPIYQTVNQFSQKISISAVHQYPRARGKYLAICEGDDYWTDPHKLQRQVDFMQAHPQYALCVHNTREINCITGAQRLINPSEQEMDIPLLSIMERGGAQFHTSSMLFRREDALRFPDYCSKYGFGDYPKSIFLALCGKVHYFPEVMSVYRQMTESSWTNQNFGAGFSEEKATRHNDAIKAILNEVDAATNGQYHEDVLRIQRNHDFYLAVQCGHYKKAVKEFPEQLRTCPANVRLSLCYRAYFPGVRKFVKRLLGRS